MTLKATVSPDDRDAALAWVRYRLDCDLGASDLASRGVRGKPSTLSTVARSLYARELRDAGYTTSAIAASIGGGFRRQSVELMLSALPPRCAK